MTDITISLDYYEAVYLRDKLSKLSELDQLKALMLETVKDTIGIALHEFEAPIATE